MHPPLKSLMILATAGLSSLAIAAPNGDFSDVKPFPEDTSFDVVDIGNDVGVGFLPSWTILTTLGDVGIDPRDPTSTVSVSDSSATSPSPPAPLTGSGVFTFEQLTNQFGDSRLEQCVLIDENVDIQYRYSVRTNRGGANNSLRVRLNSNFYTDMESCNRDLQSDSTNARLTDRQFDRNRNTFLGSAGLETDEWLQVESANRDDDGETIDEPLTHAADQIPEGAGAMRLSIQPFLFNFTGDAEDNVRIWLDDIRVEQDGHNRVLNSDFSHPDLEDGDFVTAVDSGWQVALAPRDGITPLSAAGALPFALDGENGFYFKRLTGEYDDSRLVQCISRADFPSGILQPSFNVASDEPASGLMAAVRAEFFTDDACVNEDTLDDLAGELDITGDPGQWQFVQTTSPIDGNSIAGGGSMRLTLSVRDRTGGNDAPDSGLARTVFVDDVKLSAMVLARPTFSPEGQSFVERLVVTVDGPAGSTLYITTDGTDPDTSSMALQPGETIELTETTELRAIASDGQAVSEIQSATYDGFDRPNINQSTSSSFGCSLTGGAHDPVLPILVLLALIGLARRKWLAKG